MRYLRPARLAAVAALPLAVVGAAATASFGAGATSGTTHVWSVQGVNAVTTPILFTGAIGDYGTATSEDKNGTPDMNGSYIHIVLHQGTFLVNAVPLNKKLQKLNPGINKTNCSTSFSGSGPTTVSSGTGAYAGISGTIQITISFAFVGPKTAAGKCNESENANPLASYSTVTGSGHVSF